MSKQECVAAAIKEVISNMMDEVMENVLFKDPFVKEIHHSVKPLYDALVPIEISKGSHFERHFDIIFNDVWTKLVQVIAIEVHGNCTLRQNISGRIGIKSLKRIQQVLCTLDLNTSTQEKVKRDWKTQLEYIKKGGGNLYPIDITCDIFIHNEETNTKYAIELKDHLTNTFEAKASKEKMFKLMAMTPKQVDFAYFALPNNHYGKDEYFKSAFPMKLFNVQNDEPVLIGVEFWELIGGVGTYNHLITELNLIGKNYKKQIKKSF